jgi:two-component system response regulator YesN
VALTVLIADDEPLIRKGLAESFNWAELGFVVCGQAANGLDALEQAKRLRPDLILVDIRMPLLSGLQLIEQVHKVAPDIAFIIISGHDEFEYARQAINLGVRDYLLKPVNERQLCASVCQIRDEILQRRQTQDQLAFSLSMLQKNMTILRDQFFQQLINGQLVQEEIDELLEFHSLDRSYTHFCLLRSVGQVSTDKMAGEWDRQVMRFAIQNIFAEKLVACGPAVCTADVHNNLFAFVRVDNYQPWYDLPSQLTLLLRQLLKIETRLDQYYFGADWASISEQYNIWMTESARTKTRLTERAIAYIDENSADPDLSFRRLCEALFVSSSHLSKVFKQDTGQTFVDYLTKIRIQKALLLIEEPDLRIYEIASTVGFKSQHYFSAAFKRVLGVTPSEYRLNHQRHPDLGR